MTATNATRLLRLPEVRHKTGKSRSAIYADISAGKFPAPVSLGARAVAWVEAEINEWISERVRMARAA